MKTSFMLLSVLVLAAVLAGCVEPVPPQDEDSGETATDTGTPPAETPPQEPEDIPLEEEPVVQVSEECLQACSEECVLQAKVSCSEACETYVPEACSAESKEACKESCTMSGASELACEQGCKIERNKCEALLAADCYAGCGLAEAGIECLNDCVSQCG